MAEVLGIAASAAGIIGLTGQIAQGCFFIKNFLSDVKSAPEDVQRLKRELELIGALAKTTKKVVRQSAQLGIELEDDLPAIQQCLEVVQSLRSTLQKQANLFEGDGKGKWWERMKVAARKKMLDMEVGRLERTKTGLQVLQINVSLAMQQMHQRALARSGRSIDALQVSQSDTAVTVNKLLSQVREVSTDMKSTRESVTTIATEVNDMQAHMLAMQSRIQRLEAPYSNTGPYLMESAGTSALSTALAAHEKRLADRFTNSSPQVLELNTSGSSPEFHSDENGHADHKLQRDLVRKEKRRNSHIVHKSFYKSWLFDVSVKTVETDFSNLRHNQVKTTASETNGVVMTTTYELRCKIPYLMRGIVLDHQLPSMPYAYNGGISMQMRTYNIVPNDAPILEACDNFDFDEVRRLFDSGLASPYDQDKDGYTLLDVVIQQLYDPSRRHESASFPRALQIVDILTQFNPRTSWFRTAYLIGTAAEEWAEDRETSLLRTSILRRLFESCSDIVIEDCYLPITLSNADTPEVNFALYQDFFSFYATPTGDHCEFLESDFNMLQDPEAHMLRCALECGIKPTQYIAFDSPCRPWTCSFGSYSLLETIFRADRDHVKVCCMKRLSMFIDYFGWNYPFSPNIKDPNRLPYTAFSPFPPPADYAIRLGCQDIWVAALEESKLNDDDIYDATDDFRFTGFLELFDGIQYATIEENQTEFVHALCHGHLSWMTGVIVRDWVRYQLVWMLGYVMLSRPSAELPHLDILRHFEDLINEVNCALSRRSTPGSWADANQKPLVPMVDFDLPVRYFQSEELNGHFLFWYSRYRKQRGEVIN